jgi:hypothetical protein
MDFQARDQLLLCGGSLQLNQLQQWLAPTTQTKAVPIPVISLELKNYAIVNCLVLDRRSRARQTVVG